MRSLPVSAAPSIWAPSAPNLSPRAPPVTTLIELAYLVAAVCFILGLKQLSSPKGARNGNFIAAIGMVIALVATVPLLQFTTAGLVIIAIGIVIGGGGGAVGARAGGITTRPERVA